MINDQTGDVPSATRPKTKVMSDPVVVKAGNTNSPAAKVLIDTDFEIKELFFKPTSGPDRCTIVRKVLKEAYFWEVTFFNTHPTEDVILELEVTFEATRES